MVAKSRLPRAFALVSLWLPRARGLVYTYDMLADTVELLMPAHGFASGATIQGELLSLSPINSSATVALLSQSQWLTWQTKAYPELMAMSTSDKYTSNANAFVAGTWRQPLEPVTNISFMVDGHGSEKDQYYLGVFCTRRCALRLKGQLHIVNADGHELPLEYNLLPETTLIMSIVAFLTATIMSLFLCIFWRRGRTPMHMVILGVTLLQGFALLALSISYRGMESGGATRGLARMTGMFLQKCVEVGELMMFLLLALGWRIVRPQLNTTEVRFACGISVVSLYLGIFEMTCNTTTACSGYMLSRQILHFLVWLVTIVSMNFHLQVVHHQLEEAVVSPDLARRYRKREAYTMFRWIFLINMLGPFFELFLPLPWDAKWALVIVDSIRILVIYSLLLYAFRPGPANMRLLTFVHDSAQARGDADSLVVTDSDATSTTDG